MGLWVGWDREGLQASIGGGVSGKEQKEGRRSKEKEVLSHLLTFGRRYYCLLALPTDKEVGRCGLDHTFGSPLLPFRPHLRCSAPSFPPLQHIRTFRVWLFGVVSAKHESVRVTTVINTKSIDFPQACVAPQTLNFLAP